MKVITLTAENVKRLRAVDITPGEHVQIVGGRNAQGKTSVLDALWLTLGGGQAAKGTTRPVRDGEETASVRLDLGEFVVTRTWTGDKTALRVESAEGARFSSPQGMLDALVGRLSFDPLEFTRLTGRAQVAALLDLVDLNFDELDTKRQQAYEQRTDVGRRAKAIGDVVVDDTLPAEETSASEIVGQIRAAQDAHRVYRETTEGLRIAERRVEALRAELANWEATVESRKAALAALPADLPDVEALEQCLDTVEESNAKIRTNNAARQQKAAKDALREEYVAITKTIEQLDEQKSKALAAADFPVDGLGFDDDGVTLNGVPFSQASSAEQIRVSLAMAMSLNPRLRVIRILDGSLLDADNLALIESMAREADYQVWIERVGDADKGAIVIEDGEVAA